MKRFPMLALALALAATSGCRSPEEDLHGSGGKWAGDALRSASLQQAILAQSTLYPYHFMTGTAVLNDLGRRDLGVLAARFREHDGTLNVHRGATGARLYDERLAAVRAALTASGLSPAQIALADGLPGGDGMSSGRVLRILAREAATVSNTYATGAEIDDIGTGIITDSN